ncbi:hypothetical protein ACQKDS_04800 [Serratia sp. NPDC078593]
MVHRAQARDLTDSGLAYSVSNAAGLLMQAVEQNVGAGKNYVQKRLSA